MPWQRTYDEQVSYTNDNGDIYKILVSKTGVVSIYLNKPDINNTAQALKEFSALFATFPQQPFKQTSPTIIDGPGFENIIFLFHPLYLVEYLEKLLERFATAELFSNDQELFEEISKDMQEDLANATTLGILGGGQLGRMLAIAAANLGIKVKALDPAGQEASAARVAKVVKGNFRDQDEIELFARDLANLTVEIEHVHANALQKLQDHGCNVQPSPATIALIQNKFAQKQFFASKDIPVAEYCAVTDEDSLLQAVTNFGYPLILKSKLLAYDGRGNFVIRSAEDHAEALEKLGGYAKVYAEKMQSFVKELAVIVVRDKTGRMVTYPVTETIHRNNICFITETPAQISANAWQDAESLALKVVGELQGAGAFGVEMFLMPDGKVLVNEVAPRVHNSGHYTIDACETSQFENHVRAVMGMPLGSTKLKVAHTIMFNLLGAANGEKGRKIADNLKLIANLLPGCHVHWYDKDVRAERKVGHINIVGNDAKIVRALLERIAPDACKLLPEFKPKPLVGIIMGSTSDLSTMKGAMEILKELDVPFEVSVVSAHRTPDRLVTYAQEAYARGLKVIIAGAGGAAHLPGMEAALTQLPIIGVPCVPSTAATLNGIDALFSIVQMPGGIPVAAVGIGNATNAGLLAARILAAFDPILFQKLVTRQQKIHDTVIKQAQELETKGYEEFLRIEAAKKEATKLKEAQELVTQLAPLFKGMVRETLQELFPPQPVLIYHNERSVNGTTLNYTGTRLNG